MAAGLMHDRAAVGAEVWAARLTAAAAAAGKMTGGAAHLIGTGRGRVAQETQNTRPVWRWVREGREGDGEAAAYQEI